MEWKNKDRTKYKVWMCFQVLLFGWHAWCLAGGVEDSARATVRCAWAKFNELSSILTVCGASYHMKGMMYRACVQSVLTYGTETWAMKAEDLHSLVRAERMMVRWMCWWWDGYVECHWKTEGAKWIQCTVFWVFRVWLIKGRCSRLRWFGHLERKGVDDWVL